MRDRSAIKARRRHEATEIAHMRAVTRQAAAAQHGVTTTAVPHGSGGDNGAVAWGAAMQRLAAPGHNQAMARPEAVSASHTRRAPEHGDRAHAANQLETVSWTNFKASIATKLLRLTLNRLHYAKEGLLGYQSKLKYNTTS